MSNKKEKLLRESCGHTYIIIMNNIFDYITKNKMMMEKTLNKEYLYDMKYMLTTLFYYRKDTSNSTSKDSNKDSNTLVKCEKGQSKSPGAKASTTTADSTTTTTTTTNIKKNINKIETILN